MLFARIKESSGVELNKLHTFNRCLSTISHSDTIACCNFRIRSCGIHRTATTCTKHCDARKESIDFLCIRVEHISTITLNIWRTTRNLNAQMVLCNNFYSKVILKNSNIRMMTYCLNQSTLNFKARIIGMMQNAKFRVSTFAVKIVSTIFLLIEVYTPLHQAFNTSRAIFYHLFHCTLIANIVASNQRVFNMFLKVIHLEIRYRCHTTLCFGSVSFFDCSFTNECHLTFARGGYLEGVTHSGNTRTNYQKVEFAYHRVYR